MTFVIYHNPRCTKSRQTLELLRARGIDPEIVLYLEQPPAIDRLDALCLALGKEPLEITRTGEDLFKELGLSKHDQRSRGEWLALLAANPKLIERPIVCCGNRAALGRPPENVLDLIEG